MDLYPHVFQSPVYGLFVSNIPYRSAVRAEQVAVSPDQADSWVVRRTKNRHHVHDNRYRATTPRGGHARYFSR